MFVFTVMTMGYTRSPYIAKSLMQPLLRKWRFLNIWVLIFYDDGFTVSNSKTFLRKAALQIQCDLLRSGLVPGVAKCNWFPQQVRSTNSWRESKILYFVALFACISLFVFLHFFYLFAFFIFLLFFSFCVFIAGAGELFWVF